MAVNPELWLSLDLSSSTGSVAVHHFGRGRVRCLANVALEDGGKHSESVLAGIEQALRDADTSLEKVSRYLTSLGPGSFTGLRIAFSAMKAFAFATGRPIELLSGHEILALRHLARNPDKKEIAIATQVSRGSFLVTHFSLDGRAGVSLVKEGLQETAGSALEEKPVAADLAENLVLARSRQTLTTPEQIALASPAYFGTRDYPLFTTSHQPDAQA